MRFLLSLVLILLPTIALARPANCLLESKSSRISGKVVYIYDPDSIPNFPLRGYKIILIEPRCFAPTDEDSESLIVEVQVLADPVKQAHIYQFLKTMVGKYVAVDGTMVDFSAGHYIAWPQIYPDTVVACQIAPKTKGIEKC